MANNITLVGFDEMIQKIEKASGDVMAAAEKAAHAGANAYEATLRAECAASHVPGDLVAEIKNEVARGNLPDTIKVKVGWRVPGYDRKNPAPAFKVIFLNYGTPRRSTKTGGQRVKLKTGEWVTVKQDRGAIQARDFIGRAKKRAKAQIKQAEQAAFDEVIRGLSK